MNFPKLFGGAAILLSLVLAFSLYSCEEPEQGTVEDVMSASSLKSGDGLQNCDLSGNDAFQILLNESKQDMAAFLAGVSADVAYISSDISLAGGELVFPNYYRVAEVALDLEYLNGTFRDFYWTKMDALTKKTIENGWCTAGYEDVWDEIEDSYFIYSDDQASIMFEGGLNFNSLREQVAQKTDEYLANDMKGEDPWFQEALEERLWPLVNTSHELQVQDVSLGDISEPYIPIKLLPNNPMNPIGPGAGEETMGWREWLEAIRDIIEIVGVIEDVIGDINEGNADCDGTSENTIEDQHKFHAGGRDRRFSYKLFQKEKFWDWDQTETRIEGHVKCRKRKGGDWKQDRANRLWVQYCTKQLRACDNEEFTESASTPAAKNYWKVQLEETHPHALQITEDDHYLTFTIGWKGGYDDYSFPRPVLGYELIQCSSYNGE